MSFRSCRKAEGCVRTEDGGAAASQSSYLGGGECEQADRKQTQSGYMLALPLCCGRVREASVDLCYGPNK